MEARMTRLVVLTATFLAPCVSYAVEEFGSSYNGSLSYRTENFIVTCTDRDFGLKVAEEAERFRRELAIEWLGAELPPWESKCPIQVEFKEFASGRTSFGFVQSRANKGYPVQWEMVVEGPHDRILDAVLPHEITHAIFATHFGQKLPRWADEGACTTVEHESEKKKHKIMLVEFLSTKRGIPFNRMFRMMEYPHDMLPLYAQGFSVANYLIMHEGKRHFVDFIESGLGNHDWDRAVKEFYGYDDLSDLQLTWNDWVRQGSHPWSADEANPNETIVADAQQTQPYPTNDSPGRADLNPVSRGNGPVFNAPQRSGASLPSSGSWYLDVKREHQSNQRVGEQGSITYRRSADGERPGPVSQSRRADSGTVWR